MRNSKVILLTHWLIPILASCNIGPDYTEKLSSDYFYRNEGGDIKDILSENPQGGEIPATIISYAYDQKFVIAKQKPKLPQDILYNKEYNYKYGDKAIYFWLIVHEENLVLGPLTSAEFKQARDKYNIPEDVKLE